jgi:hypothetical protein
MPNLRGVRRRLLAVAGHDMDHRTMQQTILLGYAELGLASYLVSQVR